MKVFNRKSPVAIKRFKVIDNVVNYINKNDKLPYCKSKEESTKNIACSFYSLKGRYREGKLHQEYIDYASSKGFPDLFKPTKAQSTDGESTGLNAIDNICDFIDEHDFYPRLRSKELYERKIAIQHNNLKASYKGKGNLHWYDSYPVKSNERGYPDLFNGWDHISTPLENIKLIVEYHAKYGKVPYSDRRCAKYDRYTDLLHNKFYWLRKRYNNGTLPKVCIDYLKSCGMLKILNTVHKNTDIERTKQIVEYIAVNGKLPNHWNKNKAISSLGDALRRLKRKFSHGTLDKECVVYAEKNGVNRLFEKVK